MFNYSGIAYRIFAVGLIIILFALLVLILPKFINLQKFNTKHIIVGIVILIFGIGYVAFFSYKLISPNIQKYEGIYIREYRNSTVAPPLPFTTTYIFDDGSGNPKPGFHLDNFSKKSIFNRDFNKTQKYTIYYEKDTKIIVGVLITEWCFEDRLACPHFIDKIVELWYNFIGIK